MSVLRSLACPWSTSRFLLNDTPTRYRDAFRAALIGLVVNLTLGLVKMFAGVVARSSALIADAVNSLGDALTSLAVLYGLNIAQRPADAEHPYGHMRAEELRRRMSRLALSSRLGLSAGKR